MRKFAKLVVIAVWAAGAFAVLAPWNVLSEGAVPYPAGFREWTHIKSQIIGPESPIYKKYGGIHHTYANPKAVEGLKIGTYPDGSVFVFDQLELNAKSGGVTAEGPRRFIDVMHKDDAKFAKTGGWGFEEFNSDSSTERLLTPESAAKCFACHASQKSAVTFLVHFENRDHYKEKPMEEKIFAAGTEEEVEDVRTGVHPLKIILYSGLAVGVLDGIAATVSTVVRGGTPIRVFQYVASGLLGQSAFEGGWATYALGLLLHFVVAFGASVVFISAARFVPVLSRIPFYITGPIFGVLVYFIMRDVVVPMSLVTRLNYNAAAVTIGLIIHILFVGTPIAFINSRFTKE